MITGYDNEADIEENWDYPVSLGPEKNLTSLLHVLASENGRIDLELESMYDDRFIGSATGKELEKLGAFVGIVRKTDEGDDKLRVRILGGFAAEASDTSYESFASAAMSILGADKGDITLTTPPDTIEPKTVELGVDGAILDSHPLTKNELQILLNGALSVDARAVITSEGTFAFEGDEDALEGFNEGTWSSSI
ncbi:hypothetical protein [Halomonas sp.]|uniref:hypothetical protein n=1 Tax=Halomonas sp. TaxID=1486246 RepID=UPI0035620237